MKLSKDLNRSLNYPRKSLRVCVKVIIRPQIFVKLETPIEDFHVSIKLVHSEKKYYNENKLYPAYLGHRVHEIADPVQENTWQHVGAKCFAGADWYACAFRSSLPILF